MRRKIIIEHDDNGFCIWLNGHWILDASCFKGSKYESVKEDYKVRIDTSFLKQISSKKSYYGGKTLVFKLGKRRKRKRRLIGVVRTNENQN